LITDVLVLRPFLCTIQPQINPHCPRSAVSTNCVQNA
jgi:hypothetical protein